MNNWFFVPSLEQVWILSFDLNAWEREKRQKFNSSNFINYRSLILDWYISHNPQAEYRPKITAKISPTNYVASLAMIQITAGFVWHGPCVSDPCPSRARLVWGSCRLRLGPCHMDTDRVVLNHIHIYKSRISFNLITIKLYNYANIIICSIPLLYK